MFNKGNSEEKSGDINKERIQKKNGG